ncbi:MAG: fimbrial protein [Dysgonomonas sp.]|nr:fimbrial protein [Dysgonomonas sp.]
MKNRLIHLLLFISVLIAASSCRDEENIVTPDDDDANAVNFTLNIPGLNIPSTYSMNGAKENEIKDVDILVFKVDAAGNQVYSYHKPAINIFNTNTGTVKFHAKLQEEIDRNLLIVANARNSVNGILGSITADVTSKTEVLALLEQSNTTKWEADGDGVYTNIPMITETGKMDVIIGTKVKNISFVRMLARIDVKVSVAEANFRLENIYLCNYSTNGRIAPAWDAKGVLSTTAATSPNLPTTLNRKIGNENAIKYTASGKTSYEGEIYIFEAEAADDTGGMDDPARKNATCIVIEGKYNGMGATTFYRIDFAHDGTHGTVNTYMPLLRNFKYVINVTQVNGMGETSLVNALSSYAQSNIHVEKIVYDEGELKDIIFNGRYMFGVDKSIFQTYTGRDFNGTEDFAKLIVNTNFQEGWTVKVSDNNGKNNPDWFGITQYSGSNGTSYLGITVNSSAADKAATGYLDFTAGDLQKRVSFYSVEPFIRFVSPTLDGDIIDFGHTEQIMLRSINIETNAYWKYEASDETGNQAFENIVPTPSHVVNAENVGGSPATTELKTFSFQPSNGNEQEAGTQFTSKLTFSTCNTGDTGNDKSISLTIKRTVPVYIGLFKMLPGNDQEIGSGNGADTNTTVSITATANTWWVGVARASQDENGENLATNDDDQSAGAKAEKTSNVIIRKNDLGYSRKIYLYIKYRDVNNGNQIRYVYVGEVTQRG